MKSIAKGMWCGLLAVGMASWPVVVASAGHAGRAVSEVTPATVCAACHRREFEAWRYGAGSDLDSGGRGSYHALASTDGMYGAMLAATPQELQDYCRGCHQPANPWSVPNKVDGVPAPRAVNVEEGVTCVSCHLDGAKMVSRQGVLNPLLCATCHADATLLVGTYSEWSSDYRGDRTCQECHMPRGSHAFPGFHSPSLQLKALAIGAPTVEGPIAAGVPFSFRFTLTNVGAGHSVPSSLLRLLVTRAALFDGSGAERYECVNTYYKRHALFGENPSETDVVRAGSSLVVECPSAVAPASGIYTIRVDVTQESSRFDPSRSASLRMGSSATTVVVR